MTGKADVQHGACSSSDSFVSVHASAVRAGFLSYRHVSLLIVISGATVSSVQTIMEEQ